MNCIKCDGDVFEDERQGNYVCIECGLCHDTVISHTDNISYKTENGGFNDKSQTSYTNALYPKSSLHTIIKGKGKLQTLNLWSSLYTTERSLLLVEKLIKQKCGNYLTDGYIQNVITLYNKYIHSKSNIYRGRVRLGLIGGCIFMVGMNSNTPKTYFEISELLEVTALDISQGYERLIDIIKNLDGDQVEKADYIPMYILKLGLSYSLHSHIEKIYSKLVKVKEFSNHTPQSIIIGIIYYLMELNNTKLDIDFIKTTLNVSDVTILKIYKKLKQNDDKIRKIIS